MTSWTDLESSGKGEVVYLLEIPGIGVFTTYDYTPSDSWFSTANYGPSRVYPYLMHKGLGPIKEEINFTEGSLKVSGITASIADIDGEMTALVKDWKSRTFTWLTANATDTATTFSVVDSGSFSTTNDIYIGQEACSIGAIPDATSFTALTRGILGTEAKAYTVSLDTESGVVDQPVITNDPHVLIGRKCYLHGAAMVDGVPGTTSVIYRGIIKKGIKITNGEWRIPIEHISEVFKKKIGQSLPQSPLIPGYYISGETQLSVANWTVVTSGVTNSFTEAWLDEGFYSHQELAEEWVAQIQDESPHIYPYLHLVGENYVLTANNGANDECIFTVREGDALWFLGFKAGTYYGETNVRVEVEAEDPPRLWGMHTPQVSYTEPTIEVEDGAAFTAGTAIHIADNPFAIIDSISGNTITIKAHSWDRIRGRNKTFWYIEDDQDKMLLKQAVVLADIDGNIGASITVKTALKRSLFLESGQAEPEDWVATGIASADIDFDEYDTAFASVPIGFNAWHDCITKGITVQKLFGPLFGMLGIAPRITSDGKIGFKRIQTPNSLIASTIQVNSSIWSLIDATETETSVGSSPLINQILVEHSFDYSKGDGKFGPPVKIWWKDGYNQLAANRTVKYQIRGLQVGFHGSPAAVSSLRQFAVTVNQQTAATHFGQFGREIFEAEIPCTWTAKQVQCGDVVLVTHDLVNDISVGTVGITERIGIIVGKTGQTTEQKGDSLTILFGAINNSTGIAPCALGTSYDAGNKKVTFSGGKVPTYEQSGAHDLDRFVRDDVRVEVLFIEYDTTNATTWTATIITNGISTNSNVVEFATIGAFPTPFPTDGAYMVLPDWTNAASWMTDYAYIANEDRAPTLGASKDDPKEWSL